MANANEYESALIKAETAGLKSLTSAQLEMYKKMLKESGARGNRARRI